MVLRIVQVLCLVAFFCASNALTNFGGSRSRHSYGGIRPFYSRPFYNHDFDYRMHPVRIVQTTTEAQGKEYGKESKYYDENNKKDFYVSKNQLTWTEARDACRKMGKILTSPTTQMEQTELQNYIKEHDLIPQDKFSGYWIGIHRLSANDPWILESNGQISFNFGWIPGEPNGYEGEDCVELKQDWRLGWNNYYCSGLRRFICESLPHSLESDKNIVENGVRDLHEEVAKELDNIEFQHEFVTEPKDDQVDASTEQREIITEPPEDVNLSMDDLKQTDESSDEVTESFVEIRRAYIQKLESRLGIQFSTEKADSAADTLWYPAAGTSLKSIKIEPTQSSTANDDILDDINFGPSSPASKNPESNYIDDTYSDDDYFGTGL